MRDQKNNWLSYSTIGFQIGASLLLFGWIGNKIDNYLLLSPYGLVLGLLLGGSLSMYELWKRIFPNK